MPQLVFSISFCLAAPSGVPPRNTHRLLTGSVTLTSPRTAASAWSEFSVSEDLADLEPHEAGDDACVFFFFFVISLLYKTHTHARTRTCTRVFRTHPEKYGLRLKKKYEKKTVYAAA